MMFWYGGHWMLWQAVLMWAAMLAFWGLFAWAVFTLVRYGTSRPRRQDDTPGPARRTLDVRLARGEITPDEYRQLRRLISDDVASDASTGADDDGRSRPAA